MRLVYPQPLALRWAAFLTILRTFSLGFSLLFTVTALAAFQNLLPLSLVLIGTSVSIALIAFIQSATLRCILCRCSLFLPKTCSKHPSTKPFLGSRMLRMCLDILFARSFACLHCGERCGCRNFPARLSYDDPSQASHPPQSTPYLALWQKPPPATNPATQKIREAPMKGYSPFRVLPEGELPGKAVPVPVPALAPEIVPDSPVTTVDSTLPSEPSPAPFTTALDSWRAASHTQPPRS